MEFTELLTYSGASAFVIIALQVVKPALALSDAAWGRFGALIAVALGVATVHAANVFAVDPLNLGEATLAGVLAGASASGLYQAATRTTGAIRDRLQEPPVADYDPRNPPG